MREDGTLQAWFVDAWNDLLDRTGGEFADRVADIINGSLELERVVISGRGDLATELDTANANIEDASVTAASAGGGLIVTQDKTSVTANGTGAAATLTTGAVQITVSGGVAPYSITWSNTGGDNIPAVTGAQSGNGPFSETFRKATPANTYLTGTQKVTVTDSTGGTPLSASKSVSTSIFNLDFSGVGDIGSA